jgi:hypothetical protein
MWEHGSIQAGMVKEDLRVLHLPWRRLWLMLAGLKHIYIYIYIYIYDLKDPPPQRPTPTVMHFSLTRLYLLQ